MIRLKPKGFNKMQVVPRELRLSSSILLNIPDESLFYTQGRAKGYRYPGAQSADARHVFHMRPCGYEAQEQPRTRLLNYARGVIKCGIYMPERMSYKTNTH